MFLHLAASLRLVRFSLSEMKSSGQGTEMYLPVTLGKWLPLVWIEALVSARQVGVVLFHASSGVSDVWWEERRSQGASSVTVEVWAVCDVTAADRESVIIPGCGEVRVLESRCNLHLCVPPPCLIRVQHPLNKYSSSCLCCVGVYVCGWEPMSSMGNYLDFSGECFLFLLCLNKIHSLLSLPTQTSAPFLLNVRVIFVGESQRGCS